MFGFIYYMYVNAASRRCRLTVFCAIGPLWTRSPIALDGGDERLGLSIKWPAKESADGIADDFVHLALTLLVSKLLLIFPIFSQATSWRIPVNYCRGGKQRDMPKRAKASACQILMGRDIPAPQRAASRNGNPSRFLHLDHSLRLLGWQTRGMVNLRTTP